MRLMQEIRGIFNIFPFIFQCIFLYGTPFFFEKATSETDCQNAGLDCLTDTGTKCLRLYVLYEGSGVKLKSVGWCLVLICSWTHGCST